MKTYKIQNNEWVEFTPSLMLHHYNTCVLYKEVNQKLEAYGIGIISEKKNININNIKIGDEVILNERNKEGKNFLRTVFITSIDNVGCEYGHIKGQSVCSSTWLSFNNKFIAQKEEFNKIIS